MPATYLEPPGQPAKRCSLDQLVARLRRSAAERRWSIGRLRQNLDIELAAARIREARALERVAGAGASPQVAAEGSVTRQRISENAIPAPPGAGGGGGAGLRPPGRGVHDLARGLRCQLGARPVRPQPARAGGGQARAPAAAIWNRRDAEVTVAAEVAGAYLRLRTLQARIANAAGGTGAAAAVRAAGRRADARRAGDRPGP